MKSLRTLFSYSLSVLSASGLLIISSPALFGDSQFTAAGQLKGATPTGSGTVWETKVKIDRPPKTTKKSSGTKIKKTTVRAPYLTVEWRILKRGEDGLPVEGNPISLFHTGDRLRLAIKPNQNGYLYIVQNTDTEDGYLLFPDSRINNGKNYVEKNKEILLPSQCSPAHVDERGNCWWQMAPPAGREAFTIILSREMILNLPNEVTEQGIIIKQAVIEALTRESGQKIESTSKPDLSPERGGGAGRYVTWVSNKNSKDNEELIFRIEVIHE